MNGWCLNSFAKLRPQLDKIFVIRGLNLDFSIALTFDSIEYLIWIIHEQILRRSFNLCAFYNEFVRELKLDLIE